MCVQLCNRKSAIIITLDIITYPQHSRPLESGGSPCRYVLHATRKKACSNAVHWSAPESKPTEEGVYWMHMARDMTYMYTCYR